MLLSEAEKFGCFLNNFNHSLPNDRSSRHSRILGKIIFGMLVKITTKTKNFITNLYEKIKI